jgi:hypothetical protein
MSIILVKKYVKPKSKSENEQGVPKQRRKKPVNLRHFYLSIQLSALTPKSKPDFRDYLGHYVALWYNCSIACDSQNSAARITNKHLKETLIDRIAKSPLATPQEV